VLTILALTAAHAGDVGFISSAQVIADTAHERPLEDTLEVWTRLKGSASGDLDNGRWFLAVRGEHQVLSGVEADGGDLEAHWLVWPGESGWEGTLGGPVRLRAGHLIERWGKLDLLSVVDVFTPRDTRAGLLTPQDAVRLPAPAARLQLAGESTRAELLVLPFGAQDRTALWGTDWSLLRQGMLEGLVADASGWRGDLVSEAIMQPTLGQLAGNLADMDPQFRNGLAGALGANSRPRPLDEAFDVGVRLEANGSGVDAALMGGWLRSRTPQGTLSEDLVVFIEEERLPGSDEQTELLNEGVSSGGVSWPRTLMGGAEVSFVAGQIGMRAEGAWRSVEVVPTHWLQATTSPVVGGALGLDWARGSTLSLMAEGRYEQLLEPPDDPLLVSAQSIQVAAGGRLSVLAERVQIQPVGLYDVTFKEFAARPEVHWRPNDAVQLTAGALLLGGPTEPAVEWRDALTYTGGPLSYFGDNDSVTLALAWIR